jgi:hypothetical protein
MTTCIITCLNNRPAISRIFMECVKRLDKETGGFYTIAAISTREDAKLCDKIGVPWREQANITAGHKWNAVLKGAMEFTPATHFLFMGDDDAISTEGFRLLERAASTGEDYVGFNRNYFVDTATGNAIQYVQEAQNKLIGAGAMISRKAIEAATRFAQVEVKRGHEDGHLSLQQGQKMTMGIRQAQYLSDYRNYVKIYAEKNIDLFPPNSNGLDHAREMRLTMAGYPPRAIESSRTHITDFKSAQNIWSFDSVAQKWPGNKVTFEEATWFLSGKEIDYIRTIKQK